MARPSARIRSMTIADVPAATDAIARGEWGDRGVFLRFAVEHPGCDPLVAVADGEIVGTGVGTANGPAGWVGVIYVVPDRRGGGIGKGLTEAVCDRLTARGCQSLVLVATDAGRRVYERLGFRVTSHYHALEAPGLPAARDDGDIRPFASSDVASATAIDRLATGEDRGHLLAALADSAGSIALPATDGGLAAFVVRPPWGGGATIARDTEAAVTILDHRRRLAGPDRRVRAGLLDANTPGIEALAARGWTEAWSAVRMERGPALETRPDMVYGQFNFAMG